MKKNNLDEMNVLDAQQMNAIQGGKAPKKNEEPEKELLEIEDFETPL
jgi:hypothetical protein